MGHPEGHPLPPGSMDPPDRFVSEQAWLVSHYLFKRDPPGLWFHASALPEHEPLIQQIRECFAPKRAESETP